MAILTEEYLRSKGWENKPKSAYSEEELEDGVIDSILYLQAKGFSQWCQYAFIRCDGNEWSMHIHDYIKCRVYLGIKLESIEDYEKAMAFFNDMSNR